jgi:hypothetical protein
MTPRIARREFVHRGAFSEPTLIRLAFSFEQEIQARRPPQFLPTADLPAVADQ